ncbi:MAG TPA: AAA family ATPase [Ktedonobacteraceae bacterium]|nr:AAA family ATPase [Ktedonobacteraceae bacterium]
MLKQARTTDWTFPYCPTGPDWSFNWEGMQRQFSWLQAMDGVPQSPIYHAEGNVLIHTGMVVSELIKLAEWRNLPEDERQILFASALLHDVGKPHCTKIEGDGRITSRGHARKGASIARQELWTGHELVQPAPFAVREHIAQLVRFHGLPLQFLSHPQPEKAIIAASQHVRLDHVALLSEADVRGRICPDKEEVLSRVELFRELCQEQDCYNKPRQFANEQSRFVYFRKEESDPNYVAYDDTTYEVILMSGLPGAGKDTWIREHKPDWPVISLDSIRREYRISPEEDQGHVIQTAKERARVLLRAQQSFIWNATNVSRMLRQQLIDLFLSYRAKVHIVYIDAPLSTILQRNRQRKEQVPEHVIYKLLGKLDIPDVTEAQICELYTEEL